MRWCFSWRANAAQRLGIELPATRAATRPLDALQAPKRRPISPNALLAARPIRSSEATAQTHGIDPLTGTRLPLEEPARPRRVVHFGTRRARLA